MAKAVFFDIEARDKLKRGMEALADAVRVTLGPKAATSFSSGSSGCPSSSTTE